VAPATAAIYTVTATSAADVTKSASATVAVTDLNGVLTYHNNLLRDGTNIKEYALTTSLVTTATFGKVFSCQADGAIYAQPLWVPRVTINGSPHNVIVVATQHDSVYAFDADSSPCATLWHANLLDSAHGGTAGEATVPSGPTGTGALVGNGYGDIAPVTPLGQVLASGIMLLGYAIITIPTGIVTVEMARQSRNTTSRECPHCGMNEHLGDANFCRICATRLGKE
jgi:hypothetical protein